MNGHSRLAFCLAVSQYSAADLFWRNQCKLNLKLTAPDHPEQPGVVRFSGAAPGRFGGPVQSKRGLIFPGLFPEKQKKTVHYSCCSDVFFLFSTSPEITTVYSPRGSSSALISINSDRLPRCTFSNILVRYHSPLAAWRSP